MMVRLLLIDDEEASLAASFTRAPLSDTPWVCDQADWNSITYDRLDRRAADLIVVSASSRSSQILGFLTWLRAHAEAAPTIAVLPQNPERELLRVCFDAADDCVLSPVHGDELRQRIARVLGTSDHTAAAVKDRLNNEFGFSQLVGSDPKFLREIHKISLAARGDSEVLITGETGTGKELCARAIHHLSRRRDFPFVCVDCGALPDQLFENEVFGHARGAFTGAHNVQKGLVAIAEGGTLFLDEIDSLSLQAQAKLLRFLQDHSYKALGAERFVHANVRIIAATNRNLEQAVDEKVFRRDLFFRINVLRLHMIPLRERRSDIARLARHFLDNCCAETGSRGKVLSPSVLRILDGLDWPGNVRELYNLIRRAVIFSEGPQILPAHIFPAHAASTEGIGAQPSFGAARSQALTSFERRYVEDMLRKHEGNITRAAHEALKDRRAFGRLVKRHQINPHDFKN